MKKLLFFAVCCLLGFSVFAATKDDPSITVTGEVALRVPADRAYIILYTSERDNNADAAIQDSLQSVEKTMDVVQRKHGKKTTYEVINTGLDLVLAGAQEDSGDEYVAAHCIRINSSPDDEDVFALIDDATREYAAIKPASTVSSGLPFSPIIYAVEKYEQAEADLENQALANAKARAEKQAQTVGKTLGEMISLQISLIPAAGRGLDLPTPYISNNRTGVMMVQTVTVSYQLLP